MPSETKRAQVTEKVLKVAKTASSHESLIEKLRKQWKMPLLDSGNSRTVYALPHSLVLKVENCGGYGSDCEREYETFSSGDEDVTKAYGFISNDDLSVLIAERVKPVVLHSKYRRTKYSEGESPYEKLSRRHRREFDRLENRFSDVCIFNVGFAGDRLVVLDAGS